MPLLPKPPELPTPPGPVDSLDFFGMKNAALKLMFWSIFGFFLWEFFRRQSFAHDWRSLFWFAVVSAAFAMQTAVGFHKMIITLVNEYREGAHRSEVEALQNAHQSEVEALKKAQPIYREELDEAGEFQSKRRPLYDEKMGVER
jgi:hypothetical protein